ncbi:flavin reductase family protein [Aestuariivirga sp.]|uniref:flavin reductase family protein n=1 Tax=Aestuariivirga sp. TaxID=2650926 RepID=UPI0035AF70A1
MNAMAKPLVRAEHFTAAMGLAATGVSVVTTDGPHGRFGLTVSAVSSVSADPPLVLCCINRKSPAVAAVEGNGVFAVNLLSASHRAYAETFSGRPREGRPFDFSNHDWRDGELGLPLVTDATAIFECELHDRIDAGTHRIFIGRVVAAHSGAADPLVYCNRAFRRIIHHEGN